METVMRELFTDVADFRRCAPGISGHISFDELHSTAISAKKQIVGLINSNIWNELSQDTGDTKTSLKIAFANLIMHKSVVFNIVSMRISGSADVYKSEQENMQREYIDNYFNAMDSVIRDLSEIDKFKTLWQATNNYKLIEKLQIKTTAQFNSYYGIDNSYLFFFRSIPLQRELLIDSGISSLYERVADKESQTDRLHFALAKLIIALALERFDIIELPATIRSLFSEQKSSRSGGDESSRAQDLASSLRKSAMDTIAAVEISLSEPTSGNIASNTMLNSEDDKFYFIG